MLGGKTITLPKKLSEDVKKVCERTGADPVEYVSSIVGMAVKKELDKQAIEEKLKGLGYIE
jgi:hypothetical protein